ncbi:hypothetical protein DWX58_01595 [Pseudoflavonifractor sp. AF19-9AC]|nr:hypothetical protein DWX58_01595 [Pseudoflavonifractor sp. AF19-9AC]
MGERHNNANTLTIGPEMINLNWDERTVQVFLTTDFDGQSDY